MKVISLRELKTEKGIRFSTPWIYKLIKEGRFPKPVKLGGQTTCFIESEIDAWIESKIRERDRQTAAA